MLKNIEDMTALLSGRKKVTVSVAAAQETSVLNAVNKAFLAGLINATLVGDADKISELMLNEGIDPGNFTVLNVTGSLEEQAAAAVLEVSEGRAQVLMKGLIDTSILLKTILKKEYGLRTGRVMSSVGLIESKFYHKLFLLTDAAINIQPSLDEKRQILENAVQFANSIGISEPKVGILAAKEKVYEKMPDTVDAAKLRDMNRSGEIKNCIVDGPLAFDNIISKDAAIIKGIDSPVAGDADIIVAPEIVSANSIYKTLAFLSDIKSAGVILGAKVPIVITSRADSEESKMNSIIAAALAGSIV